MELERREEQWKAWAKETEEARELMEAGQVLWKKKWPWKKWGNESPKKRFRREEKSAKWQDERSRGNGIVIMECGLGQIFLHLFTPFYISNADFHNIKLQ